MKKLFFINLIILFLLVPNLAEGLVPVYSEHSRESFIEGSAGVYRADADMEKYAVFVKDNLKKCDYSEDEISQIIQDPRLKFHEEFFKKSKIKKEEEESIKRKITKFTAEVLKKESVAEGKDFIKNNRDLLNNVENIYGVPKEIIVAILRVETIFGKIKGDYHVFNSLASRAYGQHKRIYKSKTNWKNEMRIFAEICKKNNLEIFEYMGSRAGCFGIVQFLPSSYVNLAVDGNQNGIIDLFNMEDAVHSAANYLKENGWQGGNLKYWRNRRALYRYNQALWYVNLLINYAEAVKKEIDAVKAEEE